MNPNKDSVELGKRLADLRNSKNMSQSDIAKIMGIAQTTYAGYELGNRNVNVSAIKALARAFDVSPDYLLTSENQMSESITAFEQKHLQKYHLLTDAGKKVIDNIMDTLLKYEKALH